MDMDMGYFRFQIFGLTNKNQLVSQSEFLWFGVKKDMGRHCLVLHLTCVNCVMLEFKLFYTRTARALRPQQETVAFRMPVLASMIR